MWDFGEQKPRRRPSLTPMIDVVFLLLVFFMLAARFGQDQALSLRAGGGTGEYAGPPRLVEATPVGLRLNGIATTDDLLVSGLDPLTENRGDIIVLRGADGADTQRLVDLLTLLRDAGYVNVALVE